MDDTLWKKGERQIKICSQFTRQMLYALVWSQPMTKIAAGLGISDVAFSELGSVSASDLQAANCP
jgi:hypothetical protein